MRNDALVIEEIQISMEKNEPREKKCIDFRSDQKYNMIKIEGGIQMARTGRPKADKPFDHKVTVKFKEEEYQIMVEYAETHNLSISQLIRMGVELQMKQQPNQ